MTEIEARVYIQGKLDCMKKCDTFDCKNSDECDGCDYCYAQGTFGKQKEALQVAIKVLEKQIPKKIISKHKSVNVEEQLFYGEETFFGDCPHCGALNCSLWNDKNCGHCGQAIDWSDEE